jgi:hypothetical protein
MTFYSARMGDFQAQGTLTPGSGMTYPSGWTSWVPPTYPGVTCWYLNTTTNTVYSYNWTSSTWNSVGGGGGFNPFSAGSFTKPTAASFTLTQGTNVGSTATITDLGSGRGVCLTVPDHTAGGGAHNIATAGQAAPSSTAITLKACIHRAYLPYGGGSSGIYFKDSTGKFVAISLYEGGTSGIQNHYWQLYAFASVNTLTGAILNNSGIAIPTTAPFWLQLKISSGNIISSFSADGENFSTVDTRTTSSISSYLGATLSEAGIYSDACDAGGANYEMTHYLNCYEFDLTTP